MPQTLEELLHTFDNKRPDVFAAAIFQQIFTNQFLEDAYKEDVNDHAQNARELFSNSLGNFAEAVRPFINRDDYNKLDKLVKRLKCKESILELYSEPEVKASNELLAAMTDTVINGHFDRFKGLTLASTLTKAACVFMYAITQPTRDLSKSSYQQLYNLIENMRIHGDDIGNLRAVSLASQLRLDLMEFEDNPSKTEAERETFTQSFLKTLYRENEHFSTHRNPIMKCIRAIHKAVCTFLYIHKDGLSSDEADHVYQRKMRNSSFFKTKREEQVFEIEDELSRSAQLKSGKTP